MFLAGILTVLARPISQRNLIRTPLLAAAASCLLASAGILLLTSSTALVWIVMITLVFGITLGTGASANQTALFTQASTDQIGTASGLFRTFGYIGSIASSALIAIVFRTRVSDHGLHVLALTMLAVSAAALVLTVADRQIMTQARARRQETRSQMSDAGAEAGSRHS